MSNLKKENKAKQKMLRFSFHKLDCVAIHHTEAVVVRSAKKNQKNKQIENKNSSIISPLNQTAQIKSAILNVPSLSSGSPLTGLVLFRPFENRAVFHGCTVRLELHSHQRED